MMDPMATPRSILVDPHNECDYHLVSRCVRRAMLCGVDPLTGHDYSHRRLWLIDRIRELVPCFAIDIYAYSILGNHFHLVARHDPKASQSWEDAEVARRWVDAFPPTEHGMVVEDRKPEVRELLLGDAVRLDRARSTLGSMSHFMKHLKQPIARRANVEDDCSGHFFDQRFYSGALLTEEALVAAMAYVDLNPVRARLAERLEEVTHASITERLQVNSAAALAEYLRPVLSGIDEASIVEMITMATEDVKAPEPVIAPTEQAQTSDTAAKTSRPAYAARSRMLAHSPGLERNATLVSTFGALEESRELQPQEDARLVPEHDPNPSNDERSADSEAGQQSSAADRIPTTQHACSPGTDSTANEPDACKPGATADKRTRRRRPRPAVTLRAYIELLYAMIEAERIPHAVPPSRVRGWMARTAMLKRRQRAFGTAALLNEWTTVRGLQPREKPLPV